jgi:hypothetical protein
MDPNFREADEFYKIDEAVPAPRLGIAGRSASLAGFE